MNNFDDTDAQLAAMATGAAPGVRHFPSPEEALARYVVRAAYAAELATHEFYTKTVHNETEGTVR